MADTSYVDTKRMSSRSFAFALHSKDGDVLDAACSASVTQRGLALSGGAASVALGVLTWAKLLRWAKLDEKRVSLRVATPVTKDFVLAGAAARRGAGRRVSRYSLSPREHAPRALPAPPRALDPAHLFARSAVCALTLTRQSPPQALRGARCARFWWPWTTPPPPPPLRRRPRRP